MIKSLAVALTVLICLVMFVPPCLAQNNALGVFVTFGLDTFASADIVNIPESARTVPIHQDDISGWSGPRLRTIPYVNTKIAKGYRCIGALGGDYWLGDFVQLRVAGTAALAIHLDSTEMGASLREWGQFEDNDSRGYGTSLVYYRIDSSPFSPGAFADITLGSSRSPVRLVVGYASSYTSLKLETGWDRYDALERDKIVSLRGSRNRVWTGGPYGGIVIRLASQGRNSPALRCTVGKTTQPQLDFGTAKLTRTSTYSIRVELTARFGDW